MICEVSSIISGPRCRGIWCETQTRSVPLLQFQSNQCTMHMNRSNAFYETENPSAEWLHRTSHPVSCTILSFSHFNHALCIRINNLFIAIIIFGRIKSILCCVNLHRRVCKKKSNNRRQNRMHTKSNPLQCAVKHAKKKKKTIEIASLVGIFVLCSIVLRLQVRRMHFFVNNLVLSLSSISKYRMQMCLAIAIFYFPSLLERSGE